MEALEFFYRGPSWGGYESLASPVGADLERDNETMKKGLVRLHIGLEGADLLKEDFERAAHRTPDCGTKGSADYSP